MPTRDIKIIYKFIPMLVLALAKGSLIQRQQTYCPVEDFKAKFQSTFVIRQLSYYCGQNDDVQAYGTCDYAYQCPLDNFMSARKSVSVCLEDGSWNYVTPGCEDNKKELDDVIKILESREMFGDRRSARFKDKTNVFLKTIKINSEKDTETKKAASPTLSTNIIGTTAPATEKDNYTTSTKTSISTVLNTTATTASPVPEDSAQPKKKDDKKDILAPAVKPKEWKMAKVKLLGWCRERRMCKWAAKTSSSCRIFAGMKILRTLCQNCVKFICHRKSVALMSGN